MKLLRDLDGTAADAIIVQAATLPEYKTILVKYLQWMRELNLHLNIKKMPVLSMGKKILRCYNHK